MKLAALVLASITLVGCGRAPVSRAYIDMQRVASSDPLHFVQPRSSPKPPSTVPPAKLGIPALPARTLDFSENKARLAKVQLAVDEAREQSARQLARKLREAYLQEIDTIENERMLKVGTIRGEALAKAWERIRARFLTYANARAPHAIRLALYAGFPDSDPFSRKQPADDQKALLRRFERAKNARDTLSDLDLAYDADVRSMLGQFDDEVTVEILKIRAEIEALRVEAEAKAIRDAAAQVAELTQQIESVLSGEAQVAVPALQAQSATMPGSKPIAGVPNVTMITRAEAEADRLEAVRSDVEIWAAHFGVQLVDTSSSGPDRTDEFIAWRKQRQLGP